MDLGIRMKNKLFIVLLIAAGIVGFNSVSGKPDTCVNTYIDFGSLDHDTKVIGCVPTENGAIALEVLAKSGIDLTGTEKYGLQVVCRVNDLPKPELEPCKTMPPEDAYWAVIVKRRSSSFELFSSKNKWGWADKGISDVYLNPGDSIGLVYTEKGKVRWPN